MISSNFGFGEQSAIASAYAQMYAPTRVTESCCKEGKCEGMKCDAGNLPRKHVAPKGTGSKLGKRKMMEFKKRDAKSTAKKFTPKVTKTLTEGFCITDGNKTLCTNDQNESYFNKDGISTETRIYESAVSALKDIKKINSKRKAQRKYGIRKCECVGESFQFSTKGTPVNEGWFDGITNAVGGALDTVAGAGKGLVNGVVNAGQNLVNGHPIDAVTGLVGDVAKTGYDAVGNTLNVANNVVKDTTGFDAKGAISNMTKDDEKKDASAHPQPAPQPPTSAPAVAQAVKPTPSASAMPAAAAAPAAAIATAQAPQSAPQPAPQSAPSAQQPQQTPPQTAETVKTAADSSQPQKAETKASSDLKTSTDAVTAAGNKPDGTENQPQAPKDISVAAPTKSSLKIGSTTIQPQQSDGPSVGPTNANAQRPAWQQTADNVLAKNNTAKQSTTNSVQQQPKAEQSKADGADNQAKIKELTQQKDQIEKKIAELQKAQTAAYQSTLPQAGKNWSFN